MREQIGPCVVTEPGIKLGKERRGFHEIRLLADELNHFFEQIAIGPYVEGRVVETNQVPILGATAEVRVRGLEPTRSRTVLTGIDQGFDGPDFSAEFDPSHVSLTTIMPFSAENRHLGVQPRHAALSPDGDAAVGAIRRDERDEVLRNEKEIVAVGASVRYEARALGRITQR